MHFAKDKMCWLFQNSYLRNYCFESILLRLDWWLPNVQQREGFGPSDVLEYNAHNALLYCTGYADQSI